MNNKNDFRLTRYMPFYRFVDMCANGLFLAAASLFDDRWEGHIAIRSIKSDLSEDNLKNIEIMKTHFYISSWYTGGEESAAMWKIYGKDSSAICVEISIGELMNICRKYCRMNMNHNMIIGRIQYLRPDSDDLGNNKPKYEWDYWTEANNAPQCNYNFLSVKTLQGLFFKHNAYSYENEVRIICDIFMGSGQKEIIVNDKKEIRAVLNNNSFSKIILSPGKYDSMGKIVNGVLKQYGYNAEIKRSSLD